MAALGGVGGMAAPMAGMMPVGIVNPPLGGMGPMGGMMMHQPGAGMMMPGVVAQMGMYGMVGALSQQQQPQMAHPTQGMVVADPMAVANAAASALDAAFGGGGAAVPMMALPPTPALLVQQIAPAAPAPTRVLVLLNMVTDDDLATDDDHKMLGEEVREEVSRYGKLLSMKIPRPGVRFRRYRVIFFIATIGAKRDLFPQSLILRLVHDGAKTKNTTRTGGVCAQRRQEDLPRIRQSQRCHGRREGTEGARVRSERRRCHVLWGGGLCQG